MNITYLSDLLRQSTSFTPEICQKCSVQIADLFQHHATRPSFPSVLPAAAMYQNPQDFVATVQNFFQESSQPSLNGLYGIINLTKGSSEKTVLKLANEMILGGVAVIQLRPKECETPFILQIGHLLQQLLASHQIPLIINDTPQLADRLNAQGVHLGQTDEDPAQVKAQYPRLMIGQSTHTVEQLDQAHVNPAVDWIALGPIYASPTKQGHAAVVGCKKLRAAKTQTYKPLIAIGGITSPMHAFHVGQSGVRYGAVVSALAQPHHTRFNALALGLGLWLGQHSTGETL